MAAIIMENIPIIQMLIENGADINLSDLDDSPLTLAIRTDERIAAMLIDAGANIEKGGLGKYNMGNTPLAVAIERDNIELVKRLLSMGAKIQVGESSNVLIAASGSMYRYLNNDMLSLLIIAGLNVNQQTSDGFTALMGMAQCGNVEGVRNLIKAGADVSVKKNDDDYEHNYTALHNSLFFGGNSFYKDINSRFEVVKMLLEAGADPNIKVRGQLLFQGDGGLIHGWGEYSPLMLSRDAEIARLLLDYGARIDEQGEYGRTALMIYNLSSYYYDIVQLLIERGSDINIQNKTGQTALHFAIWACNTNTIKFLVNSGADTSIRDDYGLSPIATVELFFERFSSNHEANNELEKILEDAGAKLEEKDKDLLIKYKEKPYDSFYSFYEYFWSSVLNFGFSDR